VDWAYLGRPDLESVGRTELNQVCTPADKKIGNFDTRGLDLDCWVDKRDVPAGIASVLTK
jgi:hypothetical protein